jgi:hypothetical protein
MRRPKQVVLPASEFFQAVYCTNTNRYNHKNSAIEVRWYEPPLHFEVIDSYDAETKPECLRCLRFEGRCDGYPTLKKKPSSSQSVSSSSTSSTSGRKLVPIAQKSDPNFIRPFDNCVKFRNEEEHLSFLAFQGIAKGSSCPYYGSSNFSLWNAVLQGCHKDDFIRDAVIAVGALISCERKLVKDTDGRITRAPLEYTPRYRFALKQYGRAVKKMRVQMSGEGPALRSLLIGCILIICFEAWLGNRKSWGRSPYPLSLCLMIFTRNLLSEQLLTYPLPRC